MLIQYYSMKKYYLVLRSGIQELLTYRTDLLLYTGKYAGMVLMMTFVWLAVEAQSSNQTFTRAETITYFIFSAFIYSLSNMHTFAIEEDIRLGHLTKYLVKPINPLTYYLFMQAAEVFLSTLMKGILLIPILISTGLWTPPSIWHIVVFLTYFPIVFTYSFYFFSFISTLSFWVIDIYSFRWAATSINRLLAGILVPISFFPQWFQSISVYLPFQHLAFTPIRLMQNKVSIEFAVQSLFILCGWLIFLVLIRNVLWNRGMKMFEGTGL